VKVTELSTRNTDAYKELCEQHGTVFNTLEWLEIYSRNVTVYGIFDKGDNLIGGFHLYREVRKGMAVLHEPPFTPIIGPFYKNNSSNYSKQLDYSKKILKVVADFLLKQKVQVISCALHHSVVDTQPFIWEKFKVVPQYTYLMDLTKTENELWEAMASERRNDIRKGMKDDLKVEYTDDKKVIRSLVDMTHSRRKIKLDTGIIENILNSFANGANSFAYVCWKGNIPISAAFCIHDNHTAYYILSGYDDKNKHHGAGPLTIWNCIKHAQSLKLRTFDFEGSMMPEIEKYFRGFGGKLTPFYRVNKAAIPLEMILKLVYRQWF